MVQKQSQFAKRATLGLIAFVGIFGIAKADHFIAASAATALALGLSVAWEKQNKWLSQNIFKFLGSRAYSIYLFHIPVTALVFYVTKKIGLSGVFGEIVAVSTALAFCYLVAHISLQTVEAVSMRANKKMRFESNLDSSSKLIFRGLQQVQVR